MRTWSDGIERSPLIRALRERVLICDGALGTQYQALNLTNEDFGGLEGCNEFLSISRPDIVESVHRSYLDVGADVIETNTFGSIRYVLDEYGIGNRLEEVCWAAARIARSAEGKSHYPVLLGGAALT